MALIGRLWRGEVALGQVFWIYGIAVGAIVNGLATTASLAVVASGGSALVALAIHLAPIPYNLFTLVAVLESARRFAATPAKLRSVRFAIVAWTIFLCVA
ncbi:MAG: hypothetical protein EXQ91_05505 [Alphaproteobacteria bacterium]|nr:hypothetical protein [Alphaproteobacteria bacterium]